METICVKIENHICYYIQISRIINKHNIMIELSSEVEQKYNLITRDLQEVLNPQILKNALQIKTPKGYWGTAPTGSIHIGYLLPFLKLKDIVDAGCELTILIADIHASLDNLKTSWDKVKLRTQYYILMIKTVFKVLNIDLDKVKFVVGSDYQYNREVTQKMYELASVTSVGQAGKAGTEVVKQNEDPKLTSLLYPALQALDEYFLDVDFEIGGIDQRKIFTYSIGFLPKVGIKHKCTYLMNPIVPGLSTKASSGTTKMSASDPNSKIDLLDSPMVIKKKISKAYCLEKDISDNSVLGLYKNLIFKLTSSFLLEREEKYGGDVGFSSYGQLEKGYMNGEVAPADLKINLSNFLSKFLEPVRQEFEKEENINLYTQAYS
jgi:tyrosyl-tRNA synthetase